SSYEGGVREPFIARFPGRVPAGRVSNGVASTMDVLPTVARLCGAPLPEKPLDGIDIWPLLAGEKESIDREALLYFDNYHLQCARWRNWKLHIARYNVMAYNPAPQGGRVNLPLKNSELYNLDLDPSESYDVAPENPQVVKTILARAEVLIAGFPEPVRMAWEETRKRNVGNSATGALPRILRN
ncbi:MAG TPA: sulfatase/phosphatase domain-containing protein, partial [Bryobacteraceae bacterium]|nr:sulfatase/phosphatase domain-containing protein [Bryobacteraceae bacterium]